MPAATLQITEHAAARAWERLSWRRDVLERSVHLAMRHGMHRRDATGKLRRWLDRGMMTHRCGADTRLHGRVVYIIHGGALVTVLHLPKQFIRTMEKWSHRQQGGDA